MDYFNFFEVPSSSQDPMFISYTGSWISDMAMEADREAGFKMESPTYDFCYDFSRTTAFDIESQSLREYPEYSDFFA
jgi:hypothetical protein